jgi:outer membrane protein assembly factor BamB
MRIPRLLATVAFLSAALAGAARADAPRALWEKRVVRIPAQPPALSGDTLWVVGTDRRLHAIDADDGERYWKRTLPAPPATPPVPAGGIVAVAIDAGAPRLYAARKQDGKEKWEVPIPGPITGIVAGPHGVHALGGTGRMKCVGAADGEIVWETELRYAPAGFVVDAGAARLYVLGRSDSLWCLDEATGKTVWSVPIEGMFASPPAIVAGRVACADYDGRVTLLDAADGAPAGSVLAPGPLTRSPSPGEGGTFLTVATGGEIAVWSVDAADPVWRMETRDTNAAGAVHWSGGWIIPSYLGRVHSYAATQGRRGPDWSLTFKHPIRFLPAIEGRRMAFIDMEGHVTMCEATGGLP